MFSNIVSFVRKSFSFEGRLSRNGYAPFAIVFILSGTVYALLEKRYGNPANFFQESAIYVFAHGKAAIVLIVLLIANTVKRLHDIELSGWWIWIFILTFGGGGVLYICLALIPGTKGPNKYGPDPLEKPSGVAPSSATVTE